METLQAKITKMTTAQATYVIDQTKTSLQDTMHQTVCLPDGRTLGYAEYGDPAGKPVIHCHGSNSSRLERPSDESILTKLNIRLVVPDRPGHGLSDVHPGRSLHNWADDVVTLADHLQLEQFAISGYSAGGPHAAVCAYKLADRVTKLGLISSIAPLDRANPFEDVSLGGRFAVYLGQRALWLLNLAAPLQAWLIGTNPAWVIDRFVLTLPTADQESLADITARRRLEDTTVEAYRNGGAGPVEDIRVYTAPWEFRLDQIRVPTYIWQGGSDHTATPSNGRYLANQIPHSHYTLYPDEGHYMIARHWQEILQILVAE
ncbi:alpha/beta hydrolase [Chloroflexi bacterium TSY]|nr:alpha/beta hydrolase [Chloroflexi bacterium TSY]